MYDNDEVKLDPVCELFRGDPERHSYSLMTRCVVTAGCVLIGVGTTVLSNKFVSRPLYSAMHRHVFAGITGFVVGEYLQKYTTRVAAEKDLQYYHYMTLHPEDFPPPKRIKFRDYLEPWVPVR